MNSVEDLDVFKLAHQLALRIYSVPKSFPGEETFSLVDQMRRAFREFILLFENHPNPASLLHAFNPERLERSGAIERLERFEREPR